MTRMGVRFSKPYEEADTRCHARYCWPLQPCDRSVEFAHILHSRPGAAERAAVERQHRQSHPGIAYEHLMGLLVFSCAD